MQAARNALRRFSPPTVQMAQRRTMSEPLYTLYFVKLARMRSCQGSTRSKYTKKRLAKDVYYKYDCFILVFRLL